MIEGEKILVDCSKDKNWEKQEVVQKHIEAIWFRLNRGSVTPELSRRVLVVYAAQHNTPNLVSCTNNSPLLSHIFCWSGDLEELGGAVLATGLM